MAKIQFLMLGRDPVVLQRLLRFVNENPNWEGNGTIDDKTASTIFREKNINVVIWVDNISEDSKSTLTEEFKLKNPSTIFIHHYGDSTGLLAAEINQAFDDHHFDTSKIINEASPESDKEK